MSSMSSRRPGRSGKGRMFVVVPLVLLAMVVFGGLALSSYLIPASAESTTACVVTDKDRTTDREGNSSMRVYTENCGTVEVSSNLFKGVFNSADVYSSIEVGKTYDFDATGFRIGIISMFPKVTEATEVK